ncbi:DUF7344 domain-containing protein [Halogeometricum limi]|nr:hypothetical protein [Halogeometricum limi]
MDTLYEMLSAQKRRQALKVLTSTDEPLARDELARQIVVRQRPSPRRTNTVDTTQVEKVRISLEHVHLPKLESGGVVERTPDNRYDVTPLGRDLERAARAFETEFDRDAQSGADGSETTRVDAEAVTAHEFDRDTR